MNDTPSISQLILDVAHAQDLGRTLLSFALQGLAFAFSIAVATSCSSVLLAIVLWFISSFVLSLIAHAIDMYLQYKISEERFESAGLFVGNALRGVRGWFTSSKDEVCDVAAKA